MNIEKLPYFVKERINLFAYDKNKCNFGLIEFNKICDYYPCKYSHEKIRYVNIRCEEYRHLLRRIKTENKITH